MSKHVAKVDWCQGSSFVDAWEEKNSYQYIREIVLEMIMHTYDKTLAYPVQTMNMQLAG